MVTITGHISLVLRHFQYLAVCISDHYCKCKFKAVGIWIKNLFQYSDTSQLLFKLKNKNDLEKLRLVIAAKKIKKDLTLKVEQ